MKAGICACCGYVGTTLTDFTTYRGYDGILLTVCRDAAACSERTYMARIGRAARQHARFLGVIQASLELDLETRACAAGRCAS